MQHSDKARQTAYVETVLSQRASRYLLMSPTKFIINLPFFTSYINNYRVIKAFIFIEFGVESFMYIRERLRIFKALLNILEKCLGFQTTDN